VSSPEPELVLGLIGIVLLVIGGATWTPGGRSPVLFRIVLSLATIVLARLALGPSGAALATLLLALGAWLRLRPTDAVLGLAVFGGAVAAVGGASPGIVIVFWILGLASRFFVLSRCRSRDVSPNGAFSWLRGRRRRVSVLRTEGALSPRRLAGLVVALLLLG
jgi:hypothetical protein